MTQPRSVRWSARLWTLAVTAGIAETGLALAEFEAEGVLDTGIWINVGVRALVYTSAALLVYAFATGRRWARTCLALLLSILGMASMIVPSVLLMMAGTSVIAAFGSDGHLAEPFLIVRMVHVAAVLAATGLMFAAAANSYFRLQRGGGVQAPPSPAARRTPGPPLPRAAATSPLSHRRQ